MKKWFYLAGLLLAAGCASSSIRTVEKSFSFPFVSNNQQVKAAVFRACAESGWKCRAVTQDAAEASVSVYGQTLWADVHYSPRQYRIEYKHISQLQGAQKVQAGQQAINRQYNRLVRRLSGRIDQQLKNLNQAGVHQPQQGE